MCPTPLLKPTVTMSSQIRMRAFTFPSNRGCQLCTGNSALLNTHSMLPPPKLARAYLPLSPAGAPSPSHQVFSNMCARSRASPNLPNTHAHQDRPPLFPALLPPWFLIYTCLMLSGCVFRHTCAPVLKESHYQRFLMEEIPPLSHAFHFKNGKKSQAGRAAGMPVTHEWGRAQTLCDVTEAPREKRPLVSKPH
ncbi:zinc finger CCHC domain-containing protein 13 isoform X1 [Neofelis nebulosa]|uniref:zinc finger CCHC domain-containing protein 13 isoform X1 n=1 Tax=Neofelis nebulosa TaxID=61452 RepID=UPI00272CDF7F|nr:zinc finger CCHC domain-containing protein 13 isoform X1 [Neofelis nebulosa]